MTAMNVFDPAWIAAHLLRNFADIAERNANAGRSGGLVPPMAIWVDARSHLGTIHALPARRCPHGQVMWELARLAHRSRAVACATLLDSWLLLDRQATPELGLLVTVVTVRYERTLCRRYGRADDGMLLWRTPWTGVVGPFTDTVRAGLAGLASPLALRPGNVAALEHNYVRTGPHSTGEA